MELFLIPSNKFKHFLSSPKTINSSILWACSIDPGPHTTVLIPNSWNRPASVPNETTCLELSPVRFEINSHASDLSYLYQNQL